MQQVHVMPAASVSTSHAGLHNRIVRGAEEAPDDGLRELPPRFKTMLVKNLQKELEARGERTSGKKSVLLKRLAVRTSRLHGAHCFLEWHCVQSSSHHGRCHRPLQPCPLPGILPAHLYVIPTGVGVQCPKA